MEARKTNNPLQGVKCQVNTCYFYAQGDKCTASMIEVTPKNAASSSETDCSTFRPQSY